MRFKSRLIFIVVAAFASIVALSCSTLPANEASTSSEKVSWTTRMGWRHVTYTEGSDALLLQIEPMVKGDDHVYVPDETNWLKAAPSWTPQRRTEVLSRLKSVRWNRKLKWQECACPLSWGPHEVIPGSLESTRGGRALEDERLFEPGSKVTHEQAHERWHQAARMFAEQVSGNVTIFATEVIPGSVFQAVELPALKKNPKVTLVFK